MRWWLKTRRTSTPAISLNEIFKNTTEWPQISPTAPSAAVDSASTMTRLQFRLNAKLENSISKAKKNFNTAVSKLTIEKLEFRKGGRGDD
ncbi:carnitine O-palmitoyltransferase 2, mitochondrial-like [Arapaima gigas]